RIFRQHRINEKFRLECGACEVTLARQFFVALQKLGVIMHSECFRGGARGICAKYAPSVCAENFALFAGSRFERWPADSGAGDSTQFQPGPGNGSASAPAIS